MRKRVKPFAFIIEASSGIITSSNEEEARLAALRKKARIKAIEEENLRQEASKEYEIICELYKYGRTSEEEELRMVSLRRKYGFHVPPHKGEAALSLGVEIQKDGFIHIKYNGMWMKVTPKEYEDHFASLPEYKL